MKDELVPKDLTREYSQKEILEIEKKFLAPAVGHYYEDPVLFVDGEGAVLKDSNGKEYIDLFAGICTTTQSLWLQFNGKLSGSFTPVHYMPQFHTQYL